MAMNGKFSMKAPQRRGCPLKYAHMVNILVDNQFYTAAMIADEAINHGLIDPDDHVLRKRVRMSFNKIKNARKFPPEGDKLIRLPGQRPVVAYSGERWRCAVDYRCFFSGPKAGRKSKKNTSKSSSQVTRQ